MAKTKERKKQEIENLTTKLKDSKSVVFSSFDQVGVKDVEALRKELRENDSEMIVIKKTLLKKVLKESKLEDVDINSLKGSVSAVLGYKDEVAPARLVGNFKKDHESVNIFSGILESKAIGLEEVENLAKLSSREELLARVVGSLKAPVSNFVRVCSGVLRNFIFALKAISDNEK